MCFLKAIRKNIVEKWYSIISTILPIILYLFIIIISDRDFSSIKLIDAYVVSLSLLLAPILEFFYRLFTEDGKVNLENFRTSTNKRKLGFSTILVIIVIILMSTDKSRDLFDYSIISSGVFYNILTIILIIIPLSLFDIYDDKKAYEVINDSTKKTMYKINSKNKGV